MTQDTDPSLKSVTLIIPANPPPLPCNITCSQVQGLRHGHIGGTRMPTKDTRSGFSREIKPREGVCVYRQNERKTKGDFV